MVSAKEASAQPLRQDAAQGPPRREGCAVSARSRVERVGTSTLDRPVRGHEQVGYVFHLPGAPGRSNSSKFAMSSIRLVAPVCSLDLN